MYVSHWSLLVIQVFLLLCRVLACWATGLRDIQLCLMCSQLLILFTHRQSVFFYHDSHTHFSVSHKMRARWQSVMCQSLSLNIPPLRREENRLNPFAHGWLQLIKPRCHSLTWHEPPRLSFFFFFTQVMLTEMRIGANSDVTGWSALTLSILTRCIRRIFFLP